MRKSPESDYSNSGDYSGALVVSDLAKPRVQTSGNQFVLTWTIRFEERAKIGAD
jgi:hypothetical protein